MNQETAWWAALACLRWPVPHTHGSCTSALLYLSVCLHKTLPLTLTCVWCTYIENQVLEKWDALPAVGFDDDSRLPAWFSKMCHESLTYLRRRDQCESTNTLNKQAHTLAHPRPCLTETIQLEILVQLQLFQAAVTLSTSTPPTFFISLSGLLLRPHTQLWVNENTAWPMQRNRNNDTTPSLPCAVFFSSTVSHFGSTRHLHPSIFSSSLQALCSYVR